MAVGCAASPDVIDKILGVLVAMGEGTNSSSGEKKTALQTWGLGDE